jgi:hypothetical protein
VNLRRTISAAAWPVPAGGACRWVAGLALVLTAGGGCGAGTKLAVHSMIPILTNTTLAAKSRSDLETIGTGLPANLLLLDGLIRTEPDNRDLLTLGAYLYFGYALGFVETRDPERAGEYYAIGRAYGMRALARRAAFRKGEGGDLDAFRAGLQALGKDDVAAMAWTAASWGRWLALHLDSAAAIAEMPRLEALLDRLLAVDPAFERGLPHALRGAYDALRPEMFGGNPGRARHHFDTALRLSDRRVLLYQVFYAEFYCRQVLDAECFTTTLDAVLAAPDSLLPEERLLNAIGRARALTLRAQVNELF